MPLSAKKLKKKFPDSSGFLSTLKSSTFVGQAHSICYVWSFRRSETGRITEVLLPTVFCPRARSGTPATVIMSNFNCTDGRKVVYTCDVGYATSKDHFLKHIAEPLGNFSLPFSAEMLTIDACTHVHRTERASNVHSHSCVCDPEFLDSHCPVV